MNCKQRCSVGIKVTGREIIPVFSEKESIGHVVFTTVEDNQKKAIFNFYYMYNEKNGWLPVGSVTLDDIPPTPAGEPDLDIYITVIDNGDIVSRIGARKSGMYKSFQISRDRFPQNEKEPVLKGSAIELRTAPSDLSFNAAHDGIHVSEKAGVKKNGKKKKHALPVILVIMMFITGVFIAAGFHLVPRLEVPELVKTRIEKIIPEIGSPLLGLIKTGHKNSLKSDSAGNISGPGRNTPVASGSISGTAMSTSISAGDVSGTVRGASDSAMRASASAEGVSKSISKEEDKNTVAAANKESTQPVRYRITWGDTLWKIAKHFYGEPLLFPSIAQKNSISDPNHIIAGDTLQIPSQIKDSDRINKKDRNISK